LLLTQTAVSYHFLASAVSGLWQPSGVGTAIEFWKVTKAMDVSFKPSFPYINIKVNPLAGQLLEMHSTTLALHLKHTASSPA
jgi:hypothetical protein